MKQISALILLCCLYGCSYKMVMVQPTTSAKYFRRMAILPFYTVGAEYRYGSQVSNEIQSNMVENLPQIEVVERARLDAILSEWNLVTRGIVDEATAVRAGRLVGAHVIMTGAVHDVTVIRNSGMMYGSLRVTVRIIDVESGIIKWAKVIKVRYPSTWGRASAFYEYTGVNEFTADMVTIAAKRIAGNFYPHLEREDWNLPGNASLFD